MISITNKEGVTYNFEFNWEALEKAEDADPEYDLFNDMASMERHPRLRTLQRLAGFIGKDYKDFVACGFSMVDLANVLNKAAEEAGFRLEEQELDTSSQAQA